MRITIKTKEDDTALTLLKLLGSIIALSGNAELFEIETADTIERTGEAGKMRGVARMQYKAILPEEPKEREMTIKANLEAIGAKTITGLMYERIIAKQSKGETIVEPELRAEMNLKAGSSQRSLGDLVRMNLVAKEPIVNVAAE